MLKQTLKLLNRLLKSNRTTGIFSLLFYLLMLFHPTLFHHEYFTPEKHHSSFQSSVEVLTQQGHTNVDKDCFVCSALGSMSSSDPSGTPIQIDNDSPENATHFTLFIRYSDFYSPISSRGPPVCHLA